MHVMHGASYIIFCCLMFKVGMIPFLAVLCGQFIFMFCFNDSSPSSPRLVAMARGAIVML
jgi:hypothetical protein